MRKCIACQEYEVVKNDRCEACLDDAYAEVRWLSFRKERQKMLNSWKHLSDATTTLDNRHIMK